MIDRPTALRGILFMLINMLAMTCIDGTSKLLRETMSSAHIVLLYKFSLLLGMLPWVLSKGISALKTQKIHIHIIRSFMSVLGLLFFVQGLYYVDMADAAVLENIQSILLVFIGIIFFDEKKTFTKILSVFLGFIGAIIIVNPDIINLVFKIDSNLIKDKYYGFTLIGIGFWTLNSVVVKILGKTERNKTQMFYLVFFSCIWAAPIALIKWDSINILGMNLNLIPQGIISLSEFEINNEQIKYIIFMAFCHFIHGVAYFRALQTDISVVEPFRYSKFIFSAIFGYFIFGNIPSTASYIGFALIIFSGLILLWKEVRKSWKKIEAVRAW
ncbi:MAG: DMT family transporter [Pseudomonadota bacterium]